MKTRLFLVVLLVLLTSLTVCVAEEVELQFDRYYMTLPAIDLRLNPDTPGRIDTLYSGDEVEVLQVQDIWAELKYTKDGEERIGWTWAGAVAKAVRIHLLEDEFIFHKPVYDRTQLGLISTWREPSDPDLLILWEETYEGEKWYYIMSIGEARCGYMRGTARFEIVE